MSLTNRLLECLLNMLNWKLNLWEKVLWFLDLRGVHVDNRKEARQQYCLRNRTTTRRWEGADTCESIQSLAWPAAPETKHSSSLPEISSSTTLQYTLWPWTCLWQIFSARTVGLYTPQAPRVSAISLSNTHLSAWTNSIERVGFHWSQTKILCKLEDVSQYKEHILCLVIIRANFTYKEQSSWPRAERRRSSCFGSLYWVLGCLPCSSRAWSGGGECGIRSWWLIWKRCWSNKGDEK